MLSQHKTDLYKWSIWLLCSYGFTIHVLYSLQQMIQVNIISSVEMTDDIKVPAPAVSICPYPPWSVDKLIARGLNVSCIYSFECITVNYGYLLGYINEGEDFEVAPIAWEPHELIDNVTLFNETLDVTEIEWKTTWLASLSCFTFNPNKDISTAETETIEINFKPAPVVERCWALNYFPCEEIEDICNISCERRFKYFLFQNNYYIQYIFIHREGSNPLTGSGHPMALVKEDGILEINLKYEERKQLNYLSSKCTDVKTYETCLKKCTYHEIFDHSDCTKVDNDDLVCKSLNDYWQVYNRELLILNGKNFSKISNCKCRQPCDQRDYSITSSNTVHDTGRKIRVKMESLNVWRINEFNAYTYYSFLADLGGAAGLWLGVSFLSCTFSMISLSCKLIKSRRRQKLPSVSNPITNYVKTTITHVSVKVNDPFKIVQSILTVFYFVTLLFHIFQLYHTYTQYHVSSKIYVTDDKTTEFSVIACPGFPYSMLGMIEEGLAPNNVSCKLDYAYDQDFNIPCFFDDMVSNWVKDYSSVDGNRTLASIWDNTKIDASTFFKNYTDLRKWSLFYSSRHTCYSRKFTSNLLKGKDFVAIDSPNSHYDCNQFNTSKPCIFQKTDLLRNVLLRVTKGNFPVVFRTGDQLTWDLEPGKYCSFRKPCMTEIVVNAYHRYALSTPNRPCSSDHKYSQEKCKETCTLEAAVNRFNCSPPYFNSTNYSSCTVDHYRNIGKFEVTNNDNHESCVAKCIPNCVKIFLMQSTREVLREEQDAVRIGWSKDGQKVTEERLVLPMSKFLTDSAGAIGLHLGLSLFDLFTLLASNLYILFGKLNKRCFANINNNKAVSRTFTKALHISKQCRQVCLVTAILPFIITLILLAEPMYRDFRTEPVNSVYLSHKQENLPFPSFTICVWPPFNPKKMLSMNVDLNFSRLCDEWHGDDNLNCHWDDIFTVILNTLPSNLEVEPLENLWARGAWKLEDIVKEFMWSDVQYKAPFVEEAKSLWSTSVTSLNRCFTFTPPTELTSPYNSLLIKVQDLKKLLVSRSLCYRANWYWSKELDFPAYSIHDFWKCYEKYKLILSVHPRHQYPLIPTNAVHTELKLMKDRLRHAVKITLMQIKKKSRNVAPCIENKSSDNVRPSEVSNAKCLENCIVERYSEQIGCKLPYMAMVKQIPCTKDEAANITSKYLLGPPEEFLENSSEVLKQCHLECPEPCESLIYTVADTKSKTHDIEVFFDKPTYDEVQEVWAYSTVSLVSGFGGIASFLLGLSLYSTLTLGPKMNL